MHKHTEREQKCNHTIRTSTRTAYHMPKTRSCNARLYSLNLNPPSPKLVNTSKKKTFNSTTTTTTTTNKQTEKKSQNLATSRSQPSCALSSTLKPWRHARKWIKMLGSRQGSIDIPTCSVFWALPFRIHTSAMAARRGKQTGKRASEQWRWWNPRWPWL